MNVIITTSSKGKPLVNLRGYDYRQDRPAADGGYFFRCTRKGCRARLLTDESYRFREERGGAHSHPPCPEKTSIREVRVAMKRRVERETVTVGQIYREEVLSLPDAHRPFMPTVRNIASGMQKHRRKALPALPHTWDEIEIPEPYSITRSGDQFLQIVLGDSKAVLFSTAHHLRALSEGHTLLVDGTFKTVPGVFKQLFTIHTLLGDRLMPRVYVLMQNKRSASYAAIFSWLCNKCAELGHPLEPEHIFSDFESGLIEAISATFSAARHHGCFFHFTQAVWRKVQSLGLVTFYAQNDAARNTVRQLMALAFLPVAIVRQNFDMLQAASPDGLEDLFEYFQQFWLSRVPLILWNVHGVEMRTNNFVEGWNKRFSSIVQRHHSNLWHFLSCLRDEEDATRLAEQQFSAGQDISGARNPLYQRLSRRIENLRQRYSSGEINAFAFLQGVAYVLGEKL